MAFQRLDRLGRRPGLPAQPGQVVAHLRERVVNGKERVVPGPFDGFVRDVLDVGKRLLHPGDIPRFLVRDQGGIRRQDRLQAPKHADHYDRAIVLGPIGVGVVGWLPGHAEGEHFTGLSPHRHPHAHLPKTGVDEGFQLVHDDVRRAQCCEVFLVMELRLPSEVLNLPLDGERAACQQERHAPHRHARHRQGKHLRIEVGAFLIANRLELRGAEVRAARFTLVPRHALVVVLGAPVAFLPIGVRQRLEVGRAGRVGTLRAGVLHASNLRRFIPTLDIARG